MPPTQHATDPLLRSLQTVHNVSRASGDARLNGADKGLNAGKEGVYYYTHSNEDRRRVTGARACNNPCNPTDSGIPLLAFRLHLMEAFSNEAEGLAPVEGRDQYGSPAGDRRDPDAPALLRPLPPVAEAAPPASSRTSRSGRCLGGVAGLTALTLALVAASHAALPPYLVGVGGGGHVFEPVEQQTREGGFFAFFTHGGGGGGEGGGEVLGGTFGEWLANGVRRLADGGGLTATRPEEQDDLQMHLQPKP